MEKTPKKFINTTPQEIAALSDRLTKDDSIEKYITDTFNPVVVKMLQRLSYYMSKVGLKFEEACHIIQKDPEDVKKLFVFYPRLARFFEIKELEFKKDMMAIVAKSARKGDTKYAMVLLEKRYPKEFNVKKNSTQNNEKEKDDLREAVEHIQKSGEEEALVKKESGGAIKEESGAKTMKKINEILSA